LQLHHSVESEIRFYGAGCSSDERNALVENALKTVFKNAKNINVDHDMKAAALLFVAASQVLPAF
jgi:glucosamine kinase